MSDQTGQSRRDELETLLPFYLNGTLEGPELAEVEAWLASDAEAANALAEAEAEFSATLVANEAVHPPADALSRFSRALDGVAGAEREARQPGWLARAWQGLVGLPAGAAWAVAGLAIVLMLGQGFLDRGSSPGHELAGENQVIDTRPFVLVTFDPGAAMSDIGEVLSELGVSLAAGPLPGGIYRVAISTADAAEYDRISAELAASALVQQVAQGKRPGDAP